MNQLKTAIVGCGLIGRKRSLALGHATLAACADISIEKARALAAGFPGAVAVADWKAILSDPKIDIVIASTSNEALAEVTLASIKAGKHVLVEKPAGRNTRELEAAIAAAEGSRSLVRVGFNHRYHPAIRKARELFVSGAIGDLMFIRSRYGHGGRVGYEKEWRANPVISGGGELIDQGVHIIDLARWFLGDFVHISGTARTFYWDMPVEDNAFLLLETLDRRVAFLHCSCSEWKNIFSFEIYGKTGKLHIEGLGGSYGTEKVTYYRMLPQMGPPETTTWEYPMADDSWNVEFSEFIEDIRLHRRPSPTLQDAHAALRVVDRIYSEADYDYHS